MNAHLWILATSLFEAHMRYFVTTQTLLRSKGFRSLVGEARRRVFNVGAEVKKEIQGEIEWLSAPQLIRPIYVLRERTRRILLRYLGELDKLSKVRIRDLM